MSLNLDPRQRAMLREMGVRVWQPLEKPQPAAAPVATSGLSHARPQTAKSPSFTINTVANTPYVAEEKTKINPENRAPDDVAAPVIRSAPAAAKPQVPAAQAAPAGNADQRAWGVGRAQLMYAPTGSDAEPARTGARWLVLAEVPSEALQTAMSQPSFIFNPFAGDAGRLLDNMLRAARLNKAVSAHLVPLARNLMAVSDVPASEAGPAAEALVHLAGDLSTVLAPLVDALAPDVILVMGRFAAQALLATEVPFGKLRGQVHTLGGRPAVVMLDAAYLLRNQTHKARAWDDLRLAMGLATSSATVQ